MKNKKRFKNSHLTNNRSPVGDYLESENGCVALTAQVGCWGREAARAALFWVPGGELIGIPPIQPCDTNRVFFYYDDSSPGTKPAFRSTPAQLSRLSVILITFDISSFFAPYGHRATRLGSDATEVPLAGLSQRNRPGPAFAGLGHRARQDLSTEVAVEMRRHPKSARRPYGKVPHTRLASLLMT
jgi:hypothetical protein